jgi:hypothetical protein
MLNKIVVEHEIKLSATPSFQGGNYQQTRNGTNTSIWSLQARQNADKCPLLHTQDKNHHFTQLKSCLYGINLSDDKVTSTEKL